MNNRFRLSSSVFRRLDDAGINPRLVLSRAGLPSSLLNEDKCLVTTEEFFGLYNAILGLSGDPLFGLTLGTEERWERYDPIALAALCTRTLRDALGRVARYKQLTCPEKVEISETADECAVRFVWLLATTEEPPLLVDVCFAWVLTIARRGSGGAIRPKRVEFRRPPASREEYEAYFRCPVTFNSQHNLLVFRREDLDTPFLTYNADLLATVAPQLEAELSQQAGARTIAEQVKAALKRMFAGQRPELRDVARDLRISTRTLQRRLREEHFTFQQLMREARRELARHYLLHSTLELNETAYLLGYEDANSFFRAFHEWEGVPPGEWRAGHVLPAT